MKTVIKISLIALMATGVVDASSDKPYEVKSIKIEFDIKGKDTVGKKKVIIDDYGNREFVETNIIKKSNNKVNKDHTIHYLHKGISYGVDFEDKIIHRSTGYMGTTFGENKFKETIDESLRAMHLKKIGTDTVAGVKCDIWQYGKYIKTCYYKGLPLRKESNGVVEIATKVELEAKLSRDDFKLPNFPLNGQKYTQDELEAMDSKDINKENKDLEQVDDTIKLMKEAYKKVGVVEGKAPSEEQMKKAQEYMMNAMFPKMKKEILDGAKEAKNARECLAKAKNLKEANSCPKKDEDDNFEHWDEKKKKSILSEIDSYLKSIPCVEKASNAKELKVCMPHGE